MSRISDALKRAGTPDISDGYSDLSTEDLDDFALAPDAAAAEPLEFAPDAPITAPPGSPPPVTPLAGEPVELPATRVTEPGRGFFDNSSVRVSEKLVANPDLQPVAVEQYRRVAAMLHHVQEERGIRRVLVASALAAEGKTLTATNLALTLSESYGRRVLLIDADMRRPSVNLLLGLANVSGLSEALATAEDQKLAVVQLSPRFAVLPAGRPSHDPMEGLTSQRMGRILQEAGEAFDWVIIDSPPVGVLSDANLLARMVDAVLLVIAAGSTPFAAIQRAADSIGRDRVLGVVLNRVSEQTAAPGDYYYARYYGYRGNGHRRGLFSRLMRRS
jgi:protein-tyrosine kinase